MTRKIEFEPGALSLRVFLYGSLGTVAASLALAFGFGLAWFLAVGQLDEARAALVESRSSEQTCRITVERLDARLKQIEDLFAAATGAKVRARE